MRDGFAWVIGGQLTGVVAGEITGEVTGEVQRLLTMTIPGKSNSRLQKYRLTEKGRSLLESLKGEGRGLR